MEKGLLLKTVGDNIRRLREKNELSIQQLSDVIGMEYNNLIRLEKGRTNPTIFTLQKIADALNIKIVDFFQDVY